MKNKMSGYGRYQRSLRKTANNPNRVLHSIGLQTRRSTYASILSGVGMVGVGVAVGMALGMLFAPRRGDQLRREFREKAEGMKARMGHYKARAEREAEHLREQYSPPTS